MSKQDLVERIARALMPLDKFISHTGISGVARVGDDIGAMLKEAGEREQAAAGRRAAEAILGAIRKAGLVIVPREPSEEMYAAGKQQIGLGHDSARNYSDHVWRAMVAAAEEE